jgi:endonuclease/exonuclease/phosphatase family metal-dependent hydrolase
VGLRIRVATFNVRSFRAGVDAVAEVIASEVPDILMLQECGPKSRLARAADLLDMEFVSTHRMFNRVRNAVLFRPPWRAGPPDVRDLSREGSSMRRGLIAVPLRSPGTRLTAVSAHLGLGRRERERHAREVTDHLAGIDGSLILGTDLNEGPDGEAARWIAERFYDAFAHAGEGGGESFPARGPTARIDYVFTTDGFRVVGAWVQRGRLAASASDHCPVVAELEVRTEATIP